MGVHKKMARSERAKQFMPFAALKGYPEALRRAEEEALREFGEDGAEQGSEVRNEEEKQAYKQA